MGSLFVRHFFPRDLWWRCHDNCTTAAKTASNRIVFTMVIGFIRPHSTQRLKGMIYCFFPTDARLGCLLVAFPAVSVFPEGTKVPYIPRRVVTSWTGRENRDSGGIVTKNSPLATPYLRQSSTTHEPVTLVWQMTQIHVNHVFTFYNLAMHSGYLVDEVGHAANFTNAFQNTESYFYKPWNHRIVSMLLHGIMML